MTFHYQFLAHTNGAFLKPTGGATPSLNRGQGVDGLQDTVGGMGRGQKPAEYIIMYLKIFDNQYLTCTTAIDKY